VLVYLSHGSHLSPWLTAPLAQVAGDFLQRCIYSVHGPQDKFPWPGPLEPFILNEFIARQPQARELLVGGSQGRQPFGGVLAALMLPHLPPDCLYLSSCQLRLAALQGCRAAQHSTR